MIIYATQRLTNPLLNPIRRVLPNLGGLDISPIVLILILFFIQDSLKVYLLGF
jgi:YggT family protein